MNRSKALWVRSFFRDGTGSRFSSLLGITRILWRKHEKLHKSYPIYFPILHVWIKLHYDWTNNKEKKLIVRSRWFCTVSAEKPLSWNVLVLQLLMRSAPTVLSCKAHIGIKRSISCRFHHNNMYSAWVYLSLVNIAFCFVHS